MIINMKKLILITAIVFQVFIANAQIELNILSGNQEIVKNSLDSIVYIISQDYVLQSLKNPLAQYGREGNERFGRVYFLAMLSGAKLWSNTNILKPWEKDEAFATYSTIDTLTPVVKNTWYRLASGGSFQKLDNPVGSNLKMPDTVYTNNQIMFFDFDDHGSGLPLRFMNNTPGGWLVLGTIPDGFNLADSIPVPLTIYKESPEFVSGEIKARIRTPQNENKIAGGFYLLPAYGKGTVQWMLSGIYVKVFVNNYLSAIAPFPETPRTGKAEPDVITPIKETEPEIKSEESPIPETRRKKRNNN
jgi:hypothetical protein